MSYSGLCILYLTLLPVLATSGQTLAPWALGFCNGRQGRQRRRRRRRGERRRRRRRRAKLEGPGRRDALIVYSCRMSAPVLMRLLPWMPDSAHSVAHAGGLRYVGKASQRHAWLSRVQGETTRRQQRPHPRRPCR